MSDTEAPHPDAKPAAPAVNRKVLLERVHKITGGKLRDVKAVVEATLAVMGDALKAGETLRLPPFGNARVRKEADAEAGVSMRATLRGPKPGQAAKPPKPPKAEKAPKPAAAKAARPAKAARAAKARKAKEPLAVPAEAE